MPVFESVYRKDGEIKRPTAEEPSTPSFKISRRGFLTALGLGATALVSEEVLYGAIRKTLFSSDESDFSAPPETDPFKAGDIDWTQPDVLYTHKGENIVREIRLKRKDDDLYVMFLPGRDMSTSGFSTDLYFMAASASTPKKVVALALKESGAAVIEQPSYVSNQDYLGANYRDSEVKSVGDGWQIELAGYAGVLRDYINSNSGRDVYLNVLVGKKDQKQSLIHQQSISKELGLT